MPPRTGSPPVPRTHAVLGLTLFATIALPITQGGESLLDILLPLLRESPLGGLTVLVMIACPQLFGLAVAVGHLLRDEQTAIPFVQLPISVMQGMIFLIGVSLISAPKPVAALSFIGFAFVSSGYYLYASAEAAASARGGLSLRWLVRWGALLIAATGLWLRMQALRGLHMGIALDVAVAAALLLLALNARTPVAARRTAS
ncbi:hypothetical protein [Nannocystis sp.]|uniref:hypothetical protein n=1 Tax=Nannocystis sp. TaxID=1962667 RepID=UPI0025E55ECA|nr:hypothetical protein [Nannocystis sp.]MBK7828102.1 hypothetical protein [Nannocystis sp.]